MVQYARNYILENPSCFDSSIVEETGNNIRRSGKTNDIDTKNSETSNSDVRKQSKTNDKTSNSDVKKQRKTNDIDSEKEDTDTDDSDKEEIDTDDSEEETFPQKSLYMYVLE